MVEARDRVRLAIEAPADVFARVQVRVQDLHRDGAAKLGVPAAPDHGHAALADLLVEAVPPELQPAPLRDADVAAECPPQAVPDTRNSDTGGRLLRGGGARSGRAPEAPPTAPPCP